MGGAGVAVGGGWVRMEDVDSAWHSTTQLPQGSAVLVRPDGHVAWRYRPGKEEEVGVERAAGVLERAMRVVLAGPAAQL